MNESEFNPEYYINVAKIMQEKQLLPRPRLKRTVIVNYDEWLPIVSVESGV